MTWSRFPGPGRQFICSSKINVVRVYPPMAAPILWFFMGQPYHGRFGRRSSFTASGSSLPKISASARCVSLLKRAGSR